jgi:hypothetical protein
VPGNPRIRASDADRDRATALLREHHAAGRLTAEEFHERMDKALDAKTLGEIDELMTDLPAIDLYQLPASSLRRTPPVPRQSLVPTDRPGAVSPAGFPPGTAALAAWTGATVVLGGVWLAVGVITGAWFPWWLLIVVPWLWLLVRRMRRGRE